MIVVRNIIDWFRQWTLIEWMIGVVVAFLLFLLVGMVYVEVKHGPKDVLVELDFRTRIRCIEGTKWLQYRGDREGSLAQMMDDGKPIRCSLPSR